METENITTEVVETPVDAAEPVVDDSAASTENEQKTIVLTEVEVKNSNIAFNVIVSFLTVAQKRGAFSINESAKIWECLKFFLTPDQLSGINL